MSNNKLVIIFVIILSVVLAIFQVHALLSSFVQVDHHWYPWLYVSFLLIFLPDIFIKKEQSLEERKNFY